jgi:hypothetical protein
MSSSRNDWVVQLEDDKKDLDLNLSDDEVKPFKQEQFRTLVQMKISIFAAKYLEQIKYSH